MAQSFSNADLFQLQWFQVLVVALRFFVLRSFLAGTVGSVGTAQWASVRTAVGVEAEEAEAEEAEAEAGAEAEAEAEAGAGAEAEAGASALRNEHKKFSHRMGMR